MVSTKLQALVEDNRPVLPIQVNRYVRVLNGQVGGGVLLRNHDGTRLDNGSSTNYALDVQSQATNGLHAAFVLKATSPSAAPSTSNSSVLIQDAGLFVASGKVLRLYATAGANYAEFSAAAGGDLLLGGSGAGAGNLLINGNYGWNSGQANPITLDHAVTAARTVTFQDLSGTVALLGVANAGGNLLFTDNTYDIGANGATRPRHLYLAGAAIIAGGQVSFPATQNPSADANTLDDYEEGTWTPSLGGTATYNGQQAEYTKIGRLVICNGRIDINVIGTGSTTTVSGLPFTSSAAVGALAGTVGFFSGLATNAIFLTALVDAGATTLKFAGSAAAAAAITYPWTTFGSGTIVHFTVLYYV